MPTIERTQRRYGWRPSLPDPRDKQHLYAPAPSVLDAAPPHFDNCGPNMPPIWDQGDLGSCTAHGTLRAIEFERKKDKQVDFMPSRLFQYYNTRRLEGTVNEDSGASVRDALKSAAIYGLIHETVWPYDIKTFTHRPTDQMYADAKKCVVTSMRPVPQSMRYVKAALAGGHLVVFGFSVYESFESDQVAKTGMVPIPNTNNEANVGGHCVCMVGYDDTKKLVKVANSWNTTWGDQGYCYFPYDMIVNHYLCDDFWMVDVVSC